MTSNTPEQQPFNPPPVEQPAAAPPVFSAPPSINPAVFSVAKARPRGRVTLTSILLAAAAVIAVAGIAFAVGRVTAPSGTAATNGFGRAFNGGTANGGARTFPGANGANGGGFLGGANGGLELRGTVTSVNGDTITLQLQSGQTIQVQTSSSTTYHTQASGSASDVSSGKSVIVQVGGAGGLRGLFGQNGSGTGTVTIPATDVTVSGS
jgi:hypothetical protein